LLGAIFWTLVRPAGGDGQAPSPGREFYKYPVEVEDLLSRAFPDRGGAEAFRRTIDADVGVNRLGIDVAREGGLRFSIPVVIISGVKA
jgi:hypothetical protein